MKAVGLGRPFLYANVYGAEGVEYAINLKKEIVLDAANMDLADIKAINPSYIRWTSSPVNGWYS